MNDAKIDKAMVEVGRFIDACGALKEAQKAHGESKWRYGNPKESGAVKRASMDLTRALADLRKPN